MRANKPVMLSIAAVDSAGCSGQHADIQTGQSLGVHVASVITATTAQSTGQLLALNPVSLQAFTSQLEAVRDLPIRIVKIGVIPDPAFLQPLQDFLRQLAVPVILDPVIHTSGGQAIGLPARQLVTLLPWVTLLTPNIPEAEALTGKVINSQDSMQEAANGLSRHGCHVYLKGGHTAFTGRADVCMDLLQSATLLTNSASDVASAVTILPATLQACWLVQPRGRFPIQRGTGCTLSTAIAAFVALGEVWADACCLANAYVAQGLRSACPITPDYGPIARSGWPDDLSCFPAVMDATDWMALPGFADCLTLPARTESPAGELSPSLATSRSLGLYPVVDSLEWLQRLLPQGVSTCQLRIKRLAPEILKETLANAISLARTHGCRLFINDHWALAIELGAYGVHLGQEDLTHADLQAIAKAGLRLGISTHGEFEWARALSLRPSYIAIGAIYPTATKAARVVGTARLQRWVKLLEPVVPLTAIGGIDSDNLRDVLATGVKSVAVVSAITKAVNPEKAARHLLYSLFQSDSNL
jgi:hydroxymethylpyrimidine kinase/phosphomethylpyrimidine kinase/thiamine-phosphate diphosphorylase